MAFFRVFLTYGGREIEFFFEILVFDLFEDLSGFGPESTKKAFKMTENRLGWEPPCKLGLRPMKDVADKRQKSYAK